MQVGVSTVSLASKPLSDTLSHLDRIGVDVVELGCGGYPGDDHLPREEFLDDEDAQTAFHDLLDEYEMDVSALATPTGPNNYRHSQ